MNRSQEGKHVVLFGPETGMSEKNKITEYYNRFLTRYTVHGSLSLNLIGLEDLKLNSRDEEQTFHKVA